MTNFPGYATMSRISNAFLFILLVCATLAPATQSKQYGPLTDSVDRKNASVLKIALGCDDFDGAPVTTIGAISLGFEDNSICPAPDFLEGDPLNCLWLATDTMFDEASQSRIADRLPRGSFGMVDGVVACGADNKNSLYGASLINITLVVNNRTGEVLFQANDSDE